MKPPLFLLAPPRSFTSVINAMIGQHPEAFGVPELNLFICDKIIELWYPDLKEYYLDEKIRHGLLRTVAEIFTGEQTDASIEAAEHWCAARQHMSSGDVFNELRRAADPLFLVDKTPAYTIELRRLESILEACPDARFLHLTRHPVKQCESTVALANSMQVKFANSIDFLEDKAILEPQIAWHDLNINILNFLELIVPKENSLRVRGEDIMQNPEQELAKICRWLRIRDDDKAIDDMMHPERSPFACIGPMTALFGNDPNFLKRSKFKKHTPTLPDLEAPVSWREDGKGLKPEVLELAREFGY